jgi:hypothetical protein
MTSFELFPSDLSTLRLTGEIVLETIEGIPTLVGSASPEGTAALAELAHCNPIEHQLCIQTRTSDVAAIFVEFVNDLGVVIKKFTTRMEGEADFVTRLYSFRPFVPFCQIRFRIPNANAPVYIRSISLKTAVIICDHACATIQAAGPDTEETTFVSVTDLIPGHHRIYDPAAGILRNLVHNYYVEPPTFVLEEDGTKTITSESVDWEDPNTPLLFVGDSSTESTYHIIVVDDHGCMNICDISVPETPRTIPVPVFGKSVWDAYLGSRTAPPDTPPA